MSDRSEKLKPEERSLYRRVFLYRCEDAASVEAADRQAMHAVKIWKERGAFDEERAESGSDKTIRDVMIEHIEKSDAPIAIKRGAVQGVRDFCDGIIDLQTLNKILGPVY